MTEQYLCPSYADNGLIYDCTCGRCNLDPPKSQLLIRELEELLATMKPRDKTFKLIKAELKRRGHWKNLPRGATTPGSPPTSEPTRPKL